MEMTVECTCGRTDGWHAVNCKSLVWAKLEHRTDATRMLHFYRRYCESFTLDDSFAA